MKILYAIQGTGNGHISRASEIIPILKDKGEVDILVSGKESQVRLPFPIKYELEGLGFVFGKKGGIDLLETYKKSRIKRLLQDVKTLPVEDYDLVINDFEPVSAWACYLRSRPCVGLSHQAAVISKESPRPKGNDAMGRAILKSYAPASTSYGFHFKKYNEAIFTPVIRNKVRQLATQDLGHYTVYLPAYSDQRIIRELSKIKGIRWEIFSKYVTHSISSETVRLFPICDDAFLRSMASATGIICGAGFETPAEAMFLGKKLLVIPMKNQYEQQCNAAALHQMGVAMIKSLKEKNLHHIDEWIKAGTRVSVNFPDNTRDIIDHILDMHCIDAKRLSRVTHEDDKRMVRKIRNQTLKKILSKIAT